MGSEQFKRIADGGHKLGAGREIVAGRHRGDALAADNHLRTRIFFRLKQDGVHQCGGLFAGGFGLQSLGAADLAAIGGDGGIV